MRSSSRTTTAVVVAAVVALGCAPAPARAQPAATPFDTERLFPSAPGAGWTAMDDLNLHGGLGGVLSLSIGYERNPLRVGQGENKLAVVSDRAAFAVGAAFSYARFRVYLDFTSPFVIAGQGGTALDLSYAPPSVSPGNFPDVVNDVRVGVDVRILGRPGGWFRLGAGGQLFIPSGNSPDYTTDGTFRGMVRLLLAGDARWFTWASQLGVHLRPLDLGDGAAGPRGSELLYGVAAGAKVPLDSANAWRLVVGPELFGASALRSFGASNGTTVEGLLTVRFEGTRDDAVQARFRLGAGAGLDQALGGADWRVLMGVELFGQQAQR